MLDIIKLKTVETRNYGGKKGKTKEKHATVNRMTRKCFKQKKTEYACCHIILLTIACFS